MIPGSPAPAPASHGAGAARERLGASTWADARLPASRRPGDSAGPVRPLIPSLPRGLGSARPPSSPAAPRPRRGPTRVLRRPGSAREPSASAADPRPCLRLTAPARATKSGAGPGGALRDGRRPGGRRPARQLPPGREPARQLPPGRDPARLPPASVEALLARPKAPTGPGWGTFWSEGASQMNRRDLGAATARAAPAEPAAARPAAAPAHWKRATPVAPESAGSHGSGGEGGGVARRGPGALTRLGESSPARGREESSWPGGGGGGTGGGCQWCKGEGTQLDRS